jgi:hypothetical protein
MLARHVAAVRRVINDRCKRPLIKFTSYGFEEHRRQNASATKPAAGELVVRTCEIK